MERQPERDPEQPFRSAPGAPEPRLQPSSTPGTALGTHGAGQQRQSRESTRQL